ncbi:tetratricopeptide repeat-containing glycosyltransferase family protein [Phenylobacterium aquaticum]|uniref:tetratricopeptide repeat-containing glycosyltransferase family protein n=1 Tax=Phenylobacterium aquaticum TaxID=1763816 RepID=UPI0026EC92FE|nr:tetratricopeptide repeat-containing glycosyltransferase family protein [Phenylobacterium aquaticum]
MDGGFDSLFKAGLDHATAGRWREAEEAFVAASRFRQTVNLLVNLAQARRELGAFASAAALLDVAVVNRPADLVLRSRLASLHILTGRDDRAEQVLMAALEIDPHDAWARFILSTLCLHQGRFAEGWPLYEARMEVAPETCRPPPNVCRPEWAGEPLTGRAILVWAEQGIGDQILFARFISRLKALGARQVTVVCHPRLATLFRGLSGADLVLPLQSQMPLPPHDVWIRMGSAPLHICATPADLPYPPYLPIPERRPEWDPGAAGKARIGLIWRGNPNNPVDRQRSLPWDQAERLFAAGAVSLHPEETGARDFSDTAALIGGLDLVISVDTSVAHLAGALGGPCWVLLPVMGTDWRWPRPGAADLDWYPGTRTFRQRQVGDWTRVIDEVLAELRALD